MSILVGLLFALELGGGIATNSLALISDAFHMLSDSLSLVVGFFAVKWSAKSKTTWMSYGYQRAEVVGGYTNVVALIVICMFIFFEGINRMIDPPVITSPGVVIIIGVIGLLFNMVGLCMFSDGENHGHSHGGHGGPLQACKQMCYCCAGAPEATQYGYDEYAEPAHEDFNSKAIFLHIAGDFAASIGVIVAGVIVSFTDWHWKYHVDPAVSIIVSLAVIYSSYPLSKRAAMILMQRASDDTPVAAIKARVMALTEVEDVEELHCWQLNAAHVGTIHVRARSTSAAAGENAVYKSLTKQIRGIFQHNGVERVTVQVNFAESA